MTNNVLIANRVEIAIRIAKTCKKFGIRPCRIYSEADKESVHMRYCDEAINIGGSLPLESYLVVDNIIGAANRLDCDMFHPGLAFYLKAQNLPSDARK